LSIGRDEKWVRVGWKWLVNWNQFWWMPKERSFCEYAEQRFLLEQSPLSFSSGKRGILIYAFSNGNYFSQLSVPLGPETLWKAVQKAIKSISFVLCFMRISSEPFWLSLQPTADVLFFWVEMFSNYFAVLTT